MADDGIISPGNHATASRQPQHFNVSQQRELMEVLLACSHTETYWAEQQPSALLDREPRCYEYQPDALDGWQLAGKPAEVKSQGSKGKKRVQQVSSLRYTQDGVVNSQSSTDTSAVGGTSGILHTEVRAQQKKHLPGASADELSMPYTCCSEPGTFRYIPNNGKYRSYKLAAKLESNLPDQRAQRKPHLNAEQQNLQKRIHQELRREFGTLSKEAALNEQLSVTIRPPLRLDPGLIGSPGRDQTITLSPAITSFSITQREKFVEAVSNRLQALKEEDGQQKNRRSHSEPPPPNKTQRKALDTYTYLDIFGHAQDYDTVQSAGSLSMAYRWDYRIAATPTSTQLKERSDRQGSSHNSPSVARKGREGSGGTSDAPPGKSQTPRQRDLSKQPDSPRGSVGTARSSDHEHSRKPSKTKQLSGESTDPENTNKKTTSPKGKPIMGSFQAKKLGRTKAADTPKAFLPHIAGTKMSATSSSQRFF